ncbi:hemerythrin domain-containing protein [Methylovorus glucosotrophus]|uniref:Hemerythrin HHE cation binding domain protein n=1 Tax=Methylovorus glucosotrophus (strain SIP3-4) TaxID=582744 RepID=C6XB38_METGS|nr:hemerythrin domain-containing protein [Methylovorus glucosotrophus]ACT51808.1 Hemerythrin HHE cation binding domain protein [Methylovorus glucosotrophus SIP3-4]
MTLPRQADATVKSTTRRTAQKKDVIEQLVDDHKNVKKLFKQYSKLAEKEDIEGKTLVANQICLELTVHARVEEEIFYPAARAAIHDDDLLNEAVVEHSTAKSLIGQIQSMNPSDPMYDAKMTVLSEYIDHHVEEEETEMFPKVKKAKVDLEELEAEVSKRRGQLMAEVVNAEGGIDIKKLKAAVQQAMPKH